MPKDQKVCWRIYVLFSCVFKEQSSYHFCNNLQIGEFYDSCVCIQDININSALKQTGFINRGYTKIYCNNGTSIIWNNPKILA